MEGKGSGARRSRDGGEKDTLIKLKTHGTAMFAFFTWKELDDG